ncbi:response regulator transcription factor [Roseomonas marmotae]|uniref:Response regulator transcription factor n=2 Tax=Roseomonas marmotae TaxID=2768161 RepID=A0ABS3K9L1_9PROT|nr:response regulator transcription factor [Roseomonas marmotae]QTI80981.1 response regulator transcription factor [Roseomonas marmotae]
MYPLTNVAQSEVAPAPPEWPCRLGRVLVVDGNPGARSTVLTYLTHQCIAFRSTAGDVLRYLQRNQFSLVILDSRLEQFDTFGMLRQIRSRSDVPVILITGEGQNDADRIIALELGADDILREPLDLREMLARARAILRRQEMGRRQSTAVRQNGGYRFDGWELHHCTRILKSPSGKTIDLTKTEYALLVALLEAPGRPLSRAHLMRGMRANEDIFDRSVDVHILRLRRKISANSSDSILIKTERGVGYILDASVEILF